MTTSNVSSEPCASCGVRYPTRFSPEHGALFCWEDWARENDKTILVLAEDEAAYRRWCDERAMRPYGGRVSRLRGWYDLHGIDPARYEFVVGKDWSKNVSLAEARKITAALQTLAATRRRPD